MTWHTAEWVETSVTKGTLMRQGAYVTLGSRFQRRQRLAANR
jgi:hypothetical protein